MTTIATSIDTYVAFRQLSCDLGRISANTVAATRRDLRTVFHDHLDAPLGDLTTSLLNQCLAAKQTAGSSPATMQRYTSSNSGWLSHLGCAHLVAGVYTRQGRPTRRPTRPQHALSDTQVATLTRAAAGRDRQIIQLMVDTGIRVGELVALTWGDWDAATRTLTLSGCKNRRDRVVRVSPGIELTRPVQAHDDVPLFLTRTGRAMSTRDVQNVATKIAQATGIAFTPHTLRHTFATRAHHNQVPLANIRDALGHANLATTSDYVHAA